MKKCVATCAMLAVFVWVGVAAADAPQGKLTGDSLTSLAGLAYIFAWDIIDGGTSYVGLENDYSGNCGGDSGSVTVPGGTVNIVCAHYVASSDCCNFGSPKMRFAYPDPVLAGYRVVRITDNRNKTDTVAVALVSTLPEAQAWVNTGAIGSGHAAQGWTFGSQIRGDWKITASQV